MKKNIIIVLVTIILVFCISIFIKTLTKNKQEWIQNDDVNFISDTNFVDKSLTQTENSTEPTGNVTYSPNNNNLTYSESDLKKENAYFDENGVNVEVLEYSISKTGCKVRITNTGGDPGQWNDCFWLEKKDNDVWKDVNFLPKVKYKSGFSSSILYYEDMDLDWTEIYGELEPGTYRAYITQSQASYTSSQKPVGYYSNEFEIK